MPILVQVPVDIPPQTTISYDFLQDELTRYAKSVVDSFDDEVETLSANDAAQCQTLEESQSIVLERVQKHFETKCA